MTADFRSDTLTVPTDDMRRAMASAEVGDDVLGEDPTINRLEREGAALLGTEAALLVPSGTMGNQVAIHVHCRPGDELVCEERCHVYVYEGGSPARLSGTQVRPLRTERGFPTPEQVTDAARSGDVHYPRSRLLVIENSHNMAGGTVLDPAGMAALVATAHRLGMRVHIDGARLMNAALALGCAPADLTRGVDSVSMCLSKGLGAPVGSLVAGSAEFVAAARRVRKAFGGGMRQAGVLAAAGLIALRDGPGWVAEDHRRAAALAAGLAPLRGLLVSRPDTNIVMVDLEDGDPTELLAFLEQRGVRSSAYGRRRLRFVTHHDQSDADVLHCIEAVSAWSASSRPSERNEP